MSERRLGLGGFGLHRSVFAKLMAVMLAMTLVIPLMVGGFFLFLVGPAVQSSSSVLMAEYTELLAATAPSRAAAERVAARLDVGIRYRGPQGAWSTDADIPAPVRASEAGRTACGPACFAISRPDGSTYVFAWRLHDRLKTAHDRIVIVLLGLLVAVILAAFVVLRRVLRPLSWLHAGVAKLGGGDLDVVVPRRTRDELGELTEAFNQMAARVREMVRARDQLLLDVSHELRSPLTRMKVALELGAEDAPQQRLRAYVAEMEAMVTELLELERLRTGRGLELAPHDLGSIVREAVDAHAGSPPGVRLAATPPEVVLRLDAQKVRTVLNNLLENAIKYSLPDSGPVAVTVTEDVEGALVRVADDGPGIPADCLPSLFEPFFRVDRSRSRKTGGYGLGLSLCKRVMEAHGGTIEVENNAGHGATFTLRFRKASTPLQAPQR